MHTPVCMGEDSDGKSEPSGTIEQIVRHLHAQGPLNSDSQLMVKLLDDAIACLKGIDGLPLRKKWKLSREAKRWLMADDDEHFFAFNNVCGTLAVDPELIRSCLNLSKGKRPSAGAGPMTRTNAKPPAIRSRDE